MSRPALLGTNWPTVTRFTGQGGLTGLLNNFPNGWFVPQIWTGLLMEKFWEKSILARICNTDVQDAIKNGGGEAIIRKRPPITITDWVVNQNLIFPSTNDDAITIPIKFAKSAAARIDTVDLVQSDLNFVDAMVEDMNNTHMETETSTVLTALTTQLIAAIGTDAEYIANPGIDPYDRLKATVLVSTAASSGTRTDAHYIVKQITQMRTALDQKRVPTAGRFLIVPPIIEQILILSDQATWNISGLVNKPVETGEYGIRVAGFDIITSNFIVPTTFDPGVPTSGGSDPGSVTAYGCIAGIKKGYAFARQITEVEQFDLAWLGYGKGIKSLNVFGCGISNWAASGLLCLQAS